MIQLKVLKQWIQKPLFIPCILFVCVIAGIVGTLFLTMPVIKTVTATTDPASRIIILDAGHGGEDGGTSSTDGTKEKDINLAVTLRLKAMLESAGFQVKMTRETDIAVNDPNLDTVKQRKVSDIKNRLKLIQNTPNCIFISIHQNHFSESKYNGTQVFYSKNHEDSKAIAEDIQNQVVTFIQPENKREIKPATESIYLLWNTNVPAVLVECGFLSNSDEESKLKTDNHQQLLVDGIVKGIDQYFSDDSSTEESNGAT